MGFGIWKVWENKPVLFVTLYLASNGETHVNTFIVIIIYLVCQEGLCCLMCKKTSILFKKIFSSKYNVIRRSIRFNLIIATFNINIRT